MSAIGVIGLILQGIGVVFCFGAAALNIVSYIRGKRRLDGALRKLSEHRDSLRHLGAMEERARLLHILEHGGRIEFAGGYVELTPGEIRPMTKH